MPDGYDISSTQQMAQRGGSRPGGMRPGGMRPGGMRPGGMRPGFPGRFPGRFPIRRFPIRPIIVPPFFGFPANRCFFIDQFGRCCDQFGRCCDSFGRCTFGGYPFAYSGYSDSMYGVPGSMDMMAYTDSYSGSETDSAAVFNDTTDYDYEV